MIIDLEAAGGVPLDVPYDVCIAGAGVAGIVLARHLAAAGRRVLVLEAGGMEFSDRSQDVYRGDVVGRDYFTLDSARLRYLGGTSNHWGGMSRPLDAGDFLPRANIPGSGWPIRRADLDPYLDAARDILDITPFDADRDLPDSVSRIREVAFRFNKVRFRRKYSAELAASTRITVLLNANLLEMPLQDGRGRIAGFGFRSYASGRILTATARDYVIAMGAIENARALLNANSDRPAGLGNDNDLVGRYFMEHPHVELGYYVATADARLGDAPRFWAPGHDFIRAQGIANCCLQLDPSTGNRESGFFATAMASLRAAICRNSTLTDWISSIRPNFECLSARELNRKISLPSFAVSGRLRAFSEQAPNPASRVMLAKDTDGFGRRRAMLDWRLSPLDKKTLRVSALAVGEYFARRNIGRLRLHDWVLAADADIPGMKEGEDTAGFHHMGTTRMGATAGDGVVDGNCRVHGIENLYVAGSSVFRTAGYANPTFTIVQLALRLGDRLRAAN